MAAAWHTINLSGGRYFVVQRPVASGSYGTVTIAMDTFLGREVAIKRQLFGSGAGMREARFLKVLRAIQGAGRSQGSNHVMQLLVDFTDISISHSSSTSHAPMHERRAPRYMYFVFEYMDASLESVFRMKRGLLDILRVRSWMQQVALGLSFLHNVNIVHGDLTLSNLLISASGELRITDFGISFAAADTLDDRPASVRGCSTLYVRAPESVMGTTEPGPPLDIWALGVLTLSLLSGSRLFHPTTAGEDDDAGAREVLQKQVEVLGPIDSWPEHTSLPGYSRLQDVATSSARYSRPADYFLDSTLVTRTLQAQPVGSAFGLSCLQWNPKSRPLALQAAEDDYFTKRVWRQPEKLVSPSASFSEGPCNTEDQEESKVQVAAASEGEVAEAAEAAAVPKDAEVADLCACSGNCGMLECTKRRYAKCRRGVSGRICSRVRASSGTFCSLCVCELDGCQRPRNATSGGGRFCSTQAHSVLSALPANQYSNMYGKHTIRKSWTQPLRFCAKLSYVWRLLRPEDCRAWQEYATVLGGCGKPGEPLPQTKLALLMVAHAVMQ